MAASAARESCSPARAVRTRLPNDYEPFLSEMKPSEGGPLWTAASVAAFQGSPTRANVLTSLNDGYLGSRNDEERSEMRYVVRIAECT